MAGATVTLRDAGPDDAPALVRVINDAFLVERSFKTGDRTDLTEVMTLMRSGAFVMATDASGACVGCAYAGRHGAAGTLGLLSVDPGAQGRGIGAAIVDAIEARVAESGCREIEIHVVNRRTELFPFYARRGYVACGTEPFEHPSLIAPCHFVVLRKPLPAAAT